MPHPITKRLLALADPAYRDFAASLIPGGMPMLGVRLPALRRLAKELSGTPAAWHAFLDGTSSPQWMEEVMLLGMLPGYIRGLSLSERMEQLRRFIPLISNWSICDSCCCTYRFMRQHREELLPWLLTCVRSEREYEARFGIVCFLQHYLPEPVWAPRVASALTQVQASGYYATMAVAWCCCELHLRYPDLAAPLLEATNPLPAETRRLALRKIRESRRSLPRRD